MTQHHKIATLAIAALAFAAPRAEAVVRIAPLRIAPVSLPGLGMPLVPAISLPGANIPIVSPNPIIETPAWPVLPMQFAAADLKVQPINAPALETVKFLDRILKDEKTLRPTPVRLDAAFDARSMPENDQNVVEIPRPSRPAIDQPSRPLTLPEDDLLRELGI